jgi:phosphohistidine phosphatase
MTKRKNLPLAGQDDTMVMLYLCRHGIAEEPQNGQEDEERALTEPGIKKMKKAARGFVKLVGKERVTHVLSSPLLRARQTADIVAQEIVRRGGTVEVGMCGSLGPGGKIAALVKAVRELGIGAEDGVVAVGHEPLLSAWVGELCFGGEGSALMKKGAVAAIELAEAGTHGELVWLMQPGMLREI